MQSLRFISEAAQDMTAARSLFGRADTEAKAVPAVEADSEADDADFFESASPDTRSEASHYYDCRSEGVCAVLPLFTAHFFEQKSQHWHCSCRP